MVGKERGRESMRGKVALWGRRLEELACRGRVIDCILPSMEDRIARIARDMVQREEKIL